MESAAQQLVLCTCPVCGEAGELISSRLRIKHNKTAQAQRSAAGQRPSDTANHHPKSGTPPITGSGNHGPNSLKDGRPIVSNSLLTLKELESLQDEYDHLQERCIHADSLRLVCRREDKAPTCVADLILDPSAVDNRPYMTKQGDIDALQHRVSKLLESAPEFVLRQVLAFKVRVDQMQMEVASVLAVAQRRRLRADGIEHTSFPESVHPNLTEDDEVRTAFALIAVFLSAVAGLSNRAVVTIMTLICDLVRVILIITHGPESGPLITDNILRDVPKDPRVASRRLHTATPTTLYACCPKCSENYPPLPVGSEKPYQELCTGTNLSGKVCNTPLLRSRLVGRRRYWRAIRRFPFVDPGAHITGLLSRPDLEEHLDSRDADIQETSFDVWDSELMSNLVGGDELPFATGKGKLVFALAIDWFNPYHNMEAKKKWSIGAVYLICLNLPVHLRFRLENVGLIGIIPGPMEPSLEYINPFLRPIVASLHRMYTAGLWVPRTAHHPEGRLVHVMLGLLIADLLGLRHIAGFGYPSHRLFCSYCTLTKDKMEDFSMHWTPRVLDHHREIALKWRDAATDERRAQIAKEHGVRYSALNELPYWDPFNQAPVDVLHCFMAILSKHARGAWRMNIKLDSDGTSDPFHSPPDIMTMAKAEHLLLTASHSDIVPLGKKVLIELCDRRGIRTGGRVKKQLLASLHEWRLDQGIVLTSGVVKQGRAITTFVPPSIEELKASMEFEESEAVIEAARTKIMTNRADKSAHAIGQRQNGKTLRALCYRAGLAFTGTKAEMVQLLIDKEDGKIVASYAPGMSTRANADVQRTRRFYPIMGATLLSAVRSDMERTTVPDWIKEAPKNLGDPKQGKLTSKEWRTIFTISFLVTLVRVWGQGYSDYPLTPKHKVLDNFLHLAIATMFCTQNQMSELVIEAFEFHMVTYLEEFKKLYPTESVIPYHHLALHLPHFMRQLGPWGTYGTGPPETFNGMIQDIHTNSIFGDLELTVSRQFLATSSVRAALAAGSLPKGLAALANTLTASLSSGDFGGMGRETSNASEQIGGPTGTGWIVQSVSDKPLNLDNRNTRVLAERFPDNPPGSSIIVCKSIRRESIDFVPGSVSARNSHISYTGPDGTMCFGRIHSIFQEFLQSPPNEPDSARIFLFVERYKPLRGDDAASDVYGNHPLVGHPGYKILRSVYAEFCPQMDIISASEIIGHIGRYEGGTSGTGGAILVTIQLDRAYLARQTTNGTLSSVKRWTHAVQAMVEKRTRVEEPEEAAADELNPQPKDGPSNPKKRKTRR